jgi:hypothetical protein
MQEHQDFELIFKNQSVHGRVHFPLSDGNFQGYVLMHKNGATIQVMSISYDKYSFAYKNDLDLDAPLIFTNEYSSSVDVVWEVESVTTDNGIDDDTTTTEPTDPTEPTTPEHGGSGGTIEDEDDSGLIDTILGGIEEFFIDIVLGGIEEFFTDLISAFISIYNSIVSFSDRFSTIGELFDYLKGYTIDPIVDFFNSLNTGAISILASIWEFPIIKELLIAVAAVLVIGGLLKLFVSL